MPKSYWEYSSGVGDNKDDRIRELEAEWWRTQKRIRELEKAIKDYISDFWHLPPLAQIKEEDENLYALIRMVDKTGEKDE